MMKSELISGFSGLDREQKLSIISKLSSNPEQFISALNSFRHPDFEVQSVMDGFSENSLTNFHSPWGIAPNFLINGKAYAVPMVTEESSVVAATSAAAKFWFDRGGFRSEVISMVKNGQVYFQWMHDKSQPDYYFSGLERFLREGLKPVTGRMEKRGGGILGIDLRSLSENGKGYYCIDFKFDTADSMGANFINTVLEEATVICKNYFEEKLPSPRPVFNPLMSILSNYNPECLVKVELETSVSDLDSAIPGTELSKRLVEAVGIANNDVYRAVTHNKGIFNGMDAVLVATGNDYRAVEAGVHAYASRSGIYRSLSYASCEKDRFVFGMEIPLTLGTVGGLTNLHPLAAWALDILGRPSAKELMMIVASAGLASNFSALKSLVTTGIQKGHMKLHLDNILNSLGAGSEQKAMAREYFKNRTVSYAEVLHLLGKM